MNLHSLRVLVLVLLAAAGARAQQEPAHVRVDVRVTVARPEGRVLIDRGSRDGLAIGDAVFFQPLGAEIVQGAVVEVDERTALVELQGRASGVPVGTRGEALLPAARLDRPGADERPTEQELPWQLEEDEWQPGQPLLAQVRAVRPSERVLNVTGRTYVWVDQTWTNDDDRNDSFYRAGTDLLFENPFGRGGALRFDGEVNHRTLERPDADDDQDLRLRIDRLSYRRGGDRFEPRRWEAGRFLQRGMPEFGVVDGFEYELRSEQGDKIGASIGFLPEPDLNYETGSDFQLAAFYHWAVDPGETLTVDSGFQKTFHHGDADRDLFVAKVRYLPIEGWSVQGTAWVDFYTSGDRAKDSFLELTQANVTAFRRWDSGRSLTFSYRHLAFPDIDRQEFTPPTPEELADGRNDRVAATGWTPLSERTRLHGSVGAWLDQEEFGTDADAGVEATDMLLPGGRADLSVFAADGRFSRTIGARLALGQRLGWGGWDLSYTFSSQDAVDFLDGISDFLQHRIRSSVDLHSSAGWSASFFGDVLLWDEDAAFSAGLYLQKTF